MTINTNEHDSYAYVWVYMHNNRTYVRTCIRNHEDDDAFLNYKKKKKKFFFVLVYLYASCVSKHYV